jgi:hypothetical protein
MTDPIGCVEMNLGPPSSNYGCKGKRLHSANFWMGVAGFAIMTILMARRVKGAIMLGIVFVTTISWIPGHGGSYLGPTSEIPGGCGSPAGSKFGGIFAAVMQCRRLCANTCPCGLVFKRGSSVLHQVAHNMQLQRYSHADCLYMLLLYSQH